MRWILAVHHLLASLIGEALNLTLPIILWYDCSSALKSLFVSTGLCYVLLILISFYNLVPLYKSCWQDCNWWIWGLSMLTILFQPHSLSSSRIAALKLIFLCQIYLAAIIRFSFIFKISDIHHASSINSCSWCLIIRTLDSRLLNVGCFKLKLRDWIQYRWRLLLFLWLVTLYIEICLRLLWLSPDIILQIFIWINGIFIVVN